MTTNFEILKEIFEKAIVEHSPEEWDTYVSAACGNDAGLYRSVKQLLHAHLQTDGPLDQHAASVEVAAILGPIAERPGSLIGPYKLLEQIGEGGMGTVFMAEQIRPMRRKVALKIIKPGMDTKQVIARFEAERQALALMDHPNIAKVLDAGTTGEESRQYAVGSRQLAEGGQEDSAKSNSSPPPTPSSSPPTAYCLPPATSGRPYFVMELVRGVPVTDYCDERRLSIRERLELFITICQAVQHAHQKGIIHRDLKPTNVLVTQHDGKPLVKVIDFGVAKATGQRLTEKTLFTGFAQLVGTPLYMSPEQAEMSEPDVDTRSDIYSLGVLLYELLTGSTPFDGQRLKEAAFDELRRIIREEDPLRPSAKLSTLAQQAISTISERRRCDPRQLSRLYQGELDWIVMKTLEKERNRRYETASALAADVAHYLADEPVQACPPSHWYRVRKLARRYRVALYTTSLVVAALVLGVAASTWQAVRATHAEQQAKTNEQTAKANAQLAQKNERRANAIRDFLLNAFRSPDPSRDGRSVTIFEKLDPAVKDVEEEFADDQHTQADMLDAIAQTYQGLGLYHESMLLYGKIQRLRSASQGPKDPGTIEAMCNYASVFESAGQFDKAISLYQEVLLIQKEQLPPDDPDVLATTTKLAWNLNHAGHAEKALGLFQEVLRLAQSKVKSAGPIPVDLPESDERAQEGDPHNLAVKPLFENTFEKLDDTGPNRKNVLITLNNLAKAFAEAGQVDRAISLYQQTLKLMREKLGQDDPMTLTCMYNLSMSFKVARRFDEAIPLFEETLRLRKERFDPESDIVARTMTCVGATYGAAGNKEKQAELFGESLRITRKLMSDDHPDTIWSMWQYGACLCDAGRVDEALPIWEKALPMSRIKPGVDHPTTMALSRDLAAVYVDKGRVDDAIAIAADTLKLLERERGATEPVTINAMSELAWAYQSAGRPADAIAMLKARLDRVKEVNSADDPATLAAMWYLALAYKATGRFDEEIATKIERLEQVKHKSGPTSSDALSSINDLADSCQNAGRLDECSTWREQYLQIFSKTEGPDSVHAIAAKNRLAIVRVVQGRVAEAETMLQKDLATVRDKLPADSGELSGRLHHLAMALLMQNKFAEAEAPARESLEIRKKSSPDTWGTFHSQTLLGAALLGEKKYADAEPLLVSGYEGMIGQDAKGPLHRKFAMRQVLEHLVQLYDATGRQQEAAIWKEQLTDFDKSSADKPTVAKAGN